MDLDGRVEDDDDDDDDEAPYEAVYTADLQVEEASAEAEASIEAGSPIPPQQRRQLRSHTMRLQRPPSFFTLTHARGYSDTTSMGRTGMGMTPRTGFTSVNAPRDRYDDRDEEAEAARVHDDDPMWLD